MLFQKLLIVQLLHTLFNR